MSVHKKVAILGAGGHGRVIADSLMAMIDEGSLFEFAGFVDETYPKDTHIDDGTVLGSDADLQELKQAGIIDHFIVGVGSVRGGDKLRPKIYNTALKAGLIPVSIIHPSAVISCRVEIGKGCTVMAGSVINTGAKIGDNSIVNTRASIDHDTHIGAHVHIAPGCVLSGDIDVGDNTLIGVGTSIIQGVRIGKNATIGAGSTIVKSVKPDTVVYGLRARSAHK